MGYNFLKAETAENKLFYRLEGEAAERHGFLGYLRGDYGKDGQGFWTTWFDSQQHLKTDAFRHEFNTMIGYLRDASLSQSFDHFPTFEGHCLQNMRRPVTDTAVRFIIRTEDYSYYFRCQPRQGDYDFYCLAYDNSFLMPELAGQHELPYSCFSTLSSTGEVIAIDYGEKGYKPCAWSTADPKRNRELVNESNAGLRVTKAQEQAMVGGSMFGWNTPAAKPWSYDSEGNLRHKPQKDKSRER